jgi:hypothetical protein
VAQINANAWRRTSFDSCSKRGATIVAISLTGRSALWSWVAPAGWAIGRHPVNPLVTFELGAVGLLLVAASIWHDARTRPGEASDLQVGAQAHLARIRRQNRTLVQAIAA